MSRPLCFDERRGSDCPCFTADCRERAMVVITPGVWCDPCIAPIVAALNAGGLPTIASCCGHQKRPGRISLMDGRELFVVANFADASDLADLITRTVDALDTPEATTARVERIKRLAADS